MAKRTISRLWILLVIGSLATIGVILFPFVFAHMTHKAAIKQLGRLEESLKVGDYLTGVAAIRRGCDLNLLKVRQVSSNLIIVHTPSQFGAQNWWLVITGDDDRITGVGYRLADDSKIKPRDAPPDRVREADARQWEVEFGPVDER